MPAAALLRRVATRVRGRRLLPPDAASVDLGDLRRVDPVSRSFGFDRGLPVDRHYIEAFLLRHRSDIRDRVLEIGAATYTQRFGGAAVTQSDVLHVKEGEPNATIIGDLADAEHIPSDTFDCALITQTLQLIYDAPGAIRTLHRILKPGGVLLATFPGVSPISAFAWEVTWSWGFTERSARALAEACFAPDRVEVEGCGNVLAVAAFLMGLAAEELTSAELDHRDPACDFLLTLRAVR